MKYRFLSFILVFSLFTCSNSDDSDGGNQNIQFDKIYISEDIFGGYTITLLSSNVTVQPFDGLDYLFGQGWVLDFDIEADSNNDDLPEEGTYVVGIPNGDPFTLWESNLFEYNSNDFTLNGGFYLLSREVEGSTIDISYNGDVMNISYNIKLRDSENGNDIVDLTLQGSLSQNISDNRLPDGYELFPE